MKVLVHALLSMPQYQAERNKNWYSNI